MLVMINGKHWRLTWLIWINYIAAQCRNCINNIHVHGYNDKRTQNLIKYIIRPLFNLYIVIHVLLSAFILFVHQMQFLYQSVTFPNFSEYLVQKKGQNSLLFFLHKKFRKVSLYIEPKSLSNPSTKRTITLFFMFSQSCL